MNREETTQNSLQGTTDPVQGVKQYIYRQLESGAIAEGERLPSELTLSQQLNVPRNIVREALQSLKGVGLLNSVRGSGYMLAPNFDYSLADVLHAMISVSNTSRKDINDVRQALEKKALELIFRQGGTDEAAEVLDRQVRNMEQCSRLGPLEHVDVRGCVHADKEFHRLLSVASGNIFIKAFNTSLNEHYDGYVALQWDRISIEKTRKLVEGHRDIVKQLKDGDMESAIEALDVHYKRADEVVQELCSEEVEEMRELQTLISGLQKRGFSSRQIQDKLKELQ